MIIALAGIKGGVGKTTTAVNVAVLLSRDRDVLLIDGDDQASSTDFTAVRRGTLNGEAGYTSVQILGANIRAEAQRMKKKFDDIVIDVGGRDSAGQRAALSIADVVAVPFLPSSFDLWALENMGKLIEEARAFNDNLRAVAFVNRADSQGRDNDEARELAGEVPQFSVLEVQLGNRKAFRSAASQGLGVSEYRPTDGKAVAEMEALFRCLCDVKTTS